MKAMAYLQSLVVLFFLTFALAASPQAAEHDKGLKVERGVAVLKPTKGSEVSGTVEFDREGEAVKITATVEGLAPGKHGFHIHEWGDCSAPDATSAGGHYNPDGFPHAGPEQSPRHMGDMGNLEADQNGRATYETTNDAILLSGPKSVVGRAVIVHAGEDDLTTQPTGDAGGRLACGVIGVAEPQ